MAFIFQARPDRYDLRIKIEPNRRVRWVVSRHQEEMKEGDIVYLWQAGNPEERGIYGWGVISSKVSSNRVQVTYKKNLLDHPTHRHLSVADLQSKEPLQRMRILRSAIGTNFLLSNEEDEALRSIMEDIYGPDWIPTDTNGGDDE